MLYIKKPVPVHAYVFGEDDEARSYVRSGAHGFFVKTNKGLLIQVRKGDYIIPESLTTLVDPRAIAIAPKVFESHYKKVEVSDAEVIQDEE
jgi:hypothetical protein